MFKRYRQRKHKEREWMAERVANKVRMDITREILVSIGIDKLEKVVEQGKKNRIKEGHSNYTNLAELYIQQIYGTNQKN